MPLFRAAFAAMLMVGALAGAQGQEATQSPEQTLAQNPEQTPAQNLASTNPDKAWRPTAAQLAAAEKTTLAYFAARDAGKADAAYAFLSAPQKKLISKAAFQQSLERFNAQAGAVQSRRLRAFTWYKDTPQAGPGVYVAVDYSSEFTGLALHCGYVVWQQQRNGALLQVREETNLIDKQTAATLTPDDWAKFRAEAGC